MDAGTMMVGFIIGCFLMLIGSICFVLCSALILIGIEQFRKLKKKKEEVEKHEMFC